MDKIIIKNMNKVRLIPVKDQSFITSAGFDNDEQKLIIKFSDNKGYEYFNAHLCDLINLVESYLHGVNSGTYFNSYIKGKFEYDCVEED